MEQIFSAYKEKIDKRITEFATEIASHNNPWAKITAEQIAASSRRGKTVRGSLVLMATEIFKQPLSAGAISAATAIEFIHTALLIHDDIMDHDDMRRGFPGAHKEYELLGQKLEVTDAKDFGHSYAICAGDIAIFMAQWLLAREINLEASTKNKIMALMGEEFLRVGFGQIQDLAFSQLPELPKPEEVLKMYHDKTARYTFSLPLMIGGIIANQTNEVLNALVKAGEALGLIFQLTDDALTLHGETAAVGKAIGNDIAENKKTFYHVLLRQRANAADNKRLNQIFGQPKTSANDINYVRQLITAYKIEEEIERLIEDQAQVATLEIESLPIEQGAKEKLKALAIFLRQRKK